MNKIADHAKVCYRFRCAECGDRSPDYGARPLKEVSRILKDVGWNVVNGVLWCWKCADD